MPRPLWSGSISFGLVNIPVRMYSATRDRSVKFHLLHDQDHARLQRKLVCSSEEKEVHPEHIVRGYEVSPDEYVVVRDEELEAIAPRESRTIDIRDFVDAPELDPIYFEKPYYLAPGENATRPFKLLIEAMERSRKVAVATFVMRDREHLATLRPMEGIILLETMHFADEVLDGDKVVGEVNGRVDERELKMATDLVGSMAAKFNPKKYKDEYRERVMEVIERKAKGQKIVTQPAGEEKPHRVVNLMAALEQSLAEAKKKQERARTTMTRRRKSA